MLSSFKELLDFLRTLGVEPKKGLSQNFLVDGNIIKKILMDMSLSYKAILQTLAAGGASAPVSNEKVSRLFCFKGVEKVDPPAFRQVEGGITEELTQEAMTRYNQEYRLKLRKLHGLTQNYLSQTIPDTLHPFVLR
jgi:hypothetical protein